MVTIDKAALARMIERNRAEKAREEVQLRQYEAVAHCIGPDCRSLFQAEIDGCDEEIKIGLANLHA
jgi:hypothetical protein